MNQEAVKALQMLLAEAGFSPGPIDGLWGVKTSAAVQAYLKPNSAKDKLDSRSEKNLIGVKDPLVRVIRRAAETLGTPPFMVIEGLRTEARQKELLKSGATATLNSRHLTGHAVDVVPLDSNGQISWAWPLYYPLAAAIKAAAKAENVPIEWGGDWTSFKDGPHWQLPWASFPK